VVADCEGAGESGGSRRGETERKGVWVWKWRVETGTEEPEQARPKQGAGQGGDE
jgi:hypothetical protein